MSQHTRARVWLFGAGADAEVRGTEVASHGAEGFEFTLSAGGRSRRVNVPLPGAHLLSNVLAATAVGLADGMPFDEVAGALERLDVPLRLRVLRLAAEVTLLDDTYNANPASTLAALDLLAEIPARRRLALLGDMLELSELSDESHERIGRRAAEVVDVLYTVGALARRISDIARAGGLARAQHLDSKQRALEVLRGALQPGDALLVKGSRALELETVVQELAPSQGGAT